MNITAALGCVIRLDHRGGLATGFLYRNSDNDLYLVTNKHVVVGNKNVDSPRMLRAYIPQATGGGTRRSNVKVMMIRLYDRVTKRKKWKTCADPKVDIAVLKVAPRKLQGAFLTAFSHGDAADILATGSDFTLGSSVLVLGFPGLAGDQIYDKFSNLPIVRHASIATLPFLTVTLPRAIRKDTSRSSTIYKERFFLVDGVLGPGMSGSPVIWLRQSIHEKTERKRAIGDDASWSLIGILSSGLLSLQLHTVWPVPLIEDATQTED